jgi:hypothetical protein
MSCGVSFFDGLMYDAGHMALDLMLIGAGNRSGHVRYAPVATKFRTAAKPRGVPKGDIGLRRKRPAN